jgi:hypothetical protein
LNRTLEAQEQLDLSVTNDYGTWYANKDQLSPNSFTHRPGLFHNLWQVKGDVL